MSNHGASAGRYTRIAIALHWAIAAFILFNLTLGFFMEGYPPPWRGLVVGLHISSGISVLALTVLRVIWRLMHAPPSYAASVKPWEQHLSHLVHLGLYVGMVLLPLTGWGIISAHPPKGSEGAAYLASHPELRSGPPPAPLKPGQAPPKPRTVWGVIPLPLLEPVEQVGVTAGGVKPQNVIHDELVEWHELGAFIMIGLLLLHVLGAVKHQWIDKEAQFARMGIGRREPKPAE